MSSVSGVGDERNVSCLLPHQECMCRFSLRARGHLKVIKVYLIVLEEWFEETEKGSEETGEKEGLPSHTHTIRFALQPCRRVGRVEGSGWLQGQLAELTVTEGCGGRRRTAALSEDSVGS